ncbi:MAG: 4Fe-4S dicluster domain-containing protein [Myxococcota bacterium]
MSLAPDALGDLLRLLRERGYQPIGPTLQDGAIVYDELDSADDLPAGWTDQQEAGHYRVARREDEARFGYNLGPRSWKQWLFPPKLRLFAARRVGRSFEIEPDETTPTKWAFIGVRPCELAALAVQDRVFRDGAHVDSHYARVREDAFIVTVQCAQAAPTCFCTSMETGPRAADGFDLALTELVGDGNHRLLAEAGSERGRELLGALGGDAAESADLARGEAATRRAASQISRTIDGDDLPGMLERTLEDPHWADVADRCLSCANCTMVCPTCFCSTVEEVQDLAGERTERWREWDSCFTGRHAYIHGGNQRPSVASRYRQWLTHKLGTWHEQFGTSGCVGCGRCIAWCPVGIDLTEEVAALRAHDGGPREDGDEVQEHR